MAHGSGVRATEAATSCSASLRVAARNTFTTTGSPPISRRTAWPKEPWPRTVAAVSTPSAFTS
eukprot:11176496-Lingulodinium_polyedra.AAC.1